MKKQKTYNKISDELFQEAIIEYRDNNMSLRKIQEKYKINRHILSKKLEEAGIKKTKGNHYRYHFHNFDYFEVIDSHSKAYWLGFIMADGYIQRNKGVNYGEDRIGISLNVGDIDTLKSFKQEIGATNPIKVYEEKTLQSWIDKGWSEKSTMCRILLNSQKTVDDIIDKGVIYNKSLTKEFVGYDKVPEKYIYSYLRGYMDGNGYIFLRKTKNYGYQSQLSIHSSEKFSYWISSFGDSIVRKDKRNNGWKVVFKTQSSIDLLDKIYESSTEETRMKRKYEKYKKCKNDE